METEVVLAEYAKLTVNFTGAEIEGMIKSAQSFAVEREVNLGNLGDAIKEEQIMLKKMDFDRALREIVPMFGASEASLKKLIPTPSIYYSNKLQELYDEAKVSIKQVENSPVTRVLSVLITGPIGCGKTSVAATIAQLSKFPCVKIISPEDFIGFSEQAVCQQLRQTFVDAGKSELSVIVLDDLEGLLQYSKFGPRYLNAALSTLVIMCKKAHTMVNRLLILGTTCLEDVMSDLVIAQAFHKRLEVPLTAEGTIQSVLISLETDRQVLPADKFKEKVKNLGPAFQLLSEIND